MSPLDGPIPEAAAESDHATWGCCFTPSHAKAANRTNNGDSTTGDIRK